MNLINLNSEVTSDTDLPHDFKLDESIPVMRKKPGRSGLGIFRKKRINAGIVIGYTSLLIVTSKCLSGKSFEILNYGNVEYGDGINKNSPEFPKVLKRIINDYCGKFNKVNIWCTIQSKGVEARYIVIPEVKDTHIEKAAFWAYKKEVEFEEEETVFDYDVLGRSTDNGKKIIEILACTAPKKELNEIKSVFTKIGNTLTGITVTSFAFQNLFRTGWIGEKSENISTLFIGSDWSRIDIFTNGNLILSRDVKTGTNSMLAAIKEKLEEEINSKVIADKPEIIFDEPETIIDQPETSIDAHILDLVLELDDDEEDNLVFSVEDESKPVEEQFKEEENEPASLLSSLFSENIQTPELFREKLFEIATNGEVAEIDLFFSVIRPAIDRLLRQIERTFDHYSLIKKSDKVDRLFVTGPLCCFDILIQYLGLQLGVTVETIDPFSPEKSDFTYVSNDLAVAQIDEFVPATGLAFSDSEYTLNFNYTYKEKANTKLNNVIRRLALILIIIITAAGSVSLIFLQDIKENQENEIVKLEGEVKIKEAKYDKNNIIVFADSIEIEKSKMNYYVEKYYGAAVLGEIIEYISEKIRLTSIVYEKSTKRTEDYIVLLKGLVIGNASDNEESLEKYVENLSDSKLIKSMKINKTTQVVLKGDDALYFESHLELNK